MIVNAILQIFYAFSYGISLVVSSFGEVSTNNAVTTSVTAFKTYYMSVNAYIPIDTILAIVAFDLAFEGAMFLYKLVRWGYQKVPGIT